MTEDGLKELGKLLAYIETSALKELGVRLAEVQYTHAIETATKLADGDLQRAAAILQVYAGCIVRNTAAQVSIILRDEDRSKFQQNAARAMGDLVQEGTEEGERLEKEARALALKHKGDPEAWCKAMHSTMQSARCTSIAVPEDFAEVQH